MVQEDTTPEIIVVDDSRSSIVKTFIDEIASTCANLTYAVGTKSGNPVDNWNAGLDMAHGDYVVLVHHDEVLNDRRYLRRAVDAMRGAGAQVFIAGHGLSPAGTPSRFRLARRIAKTLGYPPWTLYVMNWIGPTAAFICVNQSHTRFDPRLCWLVDVDFYYQVLSRYPKVIRSAAPHVGSRQHPGQITNSLDRPRLRYQELRLLCAEGSRSIAAWQRWAMIVAAAMRLPPWRWSSRPRRDAIIDMHGLPPSL